MQSHSRSNLSHKYSKSTTSINRSLKTKITLYLKCY
nr:MAG TPA: hypothetical protein [Caudoviricetes sp.]